MNSLLRGLSVLVPSVLVGCAGGDRGQHEEGSSYAITGASVCLFD